MSNWAEAQYVIDSLIPNVNPVGNSTVYFKKDGNFKDIIEQTLHKKVSDFTVNNFSAVVTSSHTSGHLSVDSWGGTHSGPAGSAAVSVSYADGVASIINSYVTVMGLPYNTYHESSSGGSASCRPTTSMTILGYRFNPSGNWS